MFLILVDSNNINPDLSLARYIRDYANLKGTKIKIFKFISIFLICNIFKKLKVPKLVAIKPDVVLVWSLPKFRIWFREVRKR